MTITTSYNPVSWDNMTTFNDFLSNANASVSGWLFTGIDVLVFAVLFITLAATFGWESAMLSAGFITMILSILFVYMGVMSMAVAGIFVGAIIVTIMVLVWANRYD
jgi:hypothetical protein